jgi:hypothetical protein
MARPLCLSFNLAKHLPDPLDKRFRGDRLGHVGLTGSIELDDPVGISGHHQDFRARRLRLPDQACTRAIAQHAVRRQQVRNLGLDEFSGRRDGDDGSRAMVGLVELNNQLLAKFRLAINNKNVRHT